LSDSNDYASVEGKQADADKAQQEFLAPASRTDFRKKIKVIVNQISKTSGRYEHEYAGAGPRQHHWRVEKDDANQSIQWCPSSLEAPT
jgi:hypothetical protein